MELVRKISFKKRIREFVKRDAIYHILFWLVLYVSFIFIDTRKYGLGITVSKEFINIAFYIILVYFNIYYLIPKYLSQKDYIVYGVFLLLSAIIITPIKTLFFYLSYPNNPALQDYFVSHQRMIFLSNLFIVSSSTLFQMVLDWQKHQIEKKELLHQTAQSELNFLKTQINPHFLFNTLNNLYALTLKKSDKAPEIVLKLSEMMRYMLYDCNERRVYLSKEVNYIQNYLELEKLRQKQSFNVNFSYKGLLKDQKIAPLMFIPFIENSFKHGLNQHLNEGFLDIKMDIREKEIFFTVENSKSKKAPYQGIKKAGGIGLANVKRRLNLVYPNAHDLIIEDKPNTYKIELRINLLD